MDQFKAVALVLAAGVAIFALLTVRRQFQNLGRLRREAHIPSDERSFIRKQAIRRILNGVFLLILAGMIAGTYLSGMEDRVSQLAAEREAARLNGAERPLSDDEKDMVRFWGGFWIAILIFVFFIFATAIVDIWATRRYAFQQFRLMRDDHRALLERDLAVYRQQKANDRMRPK